MTLRTNNLPSERLKSDLDDVDETIFYDDGRPFGSIFYIPGI
jgi:hypothetical protein